MYNKREEDRMNMWENEATNDNKLKYILTTLLEDEKRVDLENKGSVYLGSERDFRTQYSLWNMEKGKRL
jgi:hypothetical protein